MTTTPATPLTEAEGVLAGTAQLLAHAADCALGSASADPIVLALGLGAQLVASQALDLLPGDVDVEVEASSVTQTDPVELLKAAESLMRTMPLEDFPPGTAHLVVQICDVLREHAS